MKKYLLLVLIIALASVVYADMTVVQRVKSGGMMGQGPKDETMTIYIKGAKARINNGAKPTDSYSIVDTANKKMYMVDPSNKQIMAMSTDLMKQAGKAMGAAGQSKATVEKTGKSKTINGFNCEEYLIKTTGPMMSMTGNMWLTQDVDASEFDSFKDVAGQDMMKMFGGDELSKIKGFAILTNSKITMFGQNTEGTTEVQTISRDTIPASMFDLPKDYKVNEMPGAGKMK